MIFTMAIQENNKHIINLRLEQSKILEKLEQIRQLILTSSLPFNRINNLNNRLDGFTYDIYGYYDEKALSQNEIGNI